MRLINLSRQADKFTDRLPPKQFKQLVKEVIALAKNPTPQDAVKLKGGSEHFRKDVGEYRIIYKYNDKLLDIAVIGKRNDDSVYKIFGRK